MIDLVASCAVTQHVCNEVVNKRLEEEGVQTGLQFPIAGLGFPLKQGRV